MSEAYDPALRVLARRGADVEGIAVNEGVYGWLVGSILRDAGGDPDAAAVGADLAGMSTVPEVIAANHMGARVLGISCVTNMAAGLRRQALPRRGQGDRRAREAPLRRAC